MPQYDSFYHKDVQCKRDDTAKRNDISIQSTIEISKIKFKLGNKRGKKTFECM